jgi:hypothetical protein
MTTPTDAEVEALANQIYTAGELGSSSTNMARYILTHYEPRKGEPTPRVEDDPPITCLSNNPHGYCETCGSYGLERKCCPDCCHSPPPPPQPTPRIETTIRPPRCVDARAGMTCTRASGHDGDHSNSVWSWLENTPLTPREPPKATPNAKPIHCVDCAALWPTRCHRHDRGSTAAHRADERGASRADSAAPVTIELGPVTLRTLIAAIIGAANGGGKKWAGDTVIDTGDLLAELAKTKEPTP